MKKGNGKRNGNGKAAELRREIRALRASLREFRPECHDPRALGQLRVRISQAREELGRALHRHS